MNLEIRRIHWSHLEMMLEAALNETGIAMVRLPGGVSAGWPSKDGQYWEYLA